MGSKFDTQTTVLVIDDDPAFRKSVDRLLRSVGLKAKMFSSASQFLAEDRPIGPACIVLDVRMPGMSGLEFQSELAAADIPIPIIFITGHGDIPMSVQAMKGGAIEFLTKPFRDQDLIDAINVGLARDIARYERRQAQETLNARFQLLTPREQEIMTHVVQGRLSKQIANDIGVSEATVKVHRSNLMRKLKVRGLPELGIVADRLNLILRKT